MQPQGAQGSASPRLDRGTQLVTAGPTSTDGYRGTVYEEAGEATIWRSVPGREDDDRAWLRARVDGTQPADPEDNRNRAARRAKGRMRRFAVRNGLAWLVTATYRPPQPTDPDVVLRDCHAFQRRLAAARPGLVWVRVFERHASGTLHVHYLTNGPHGRERETREIAGIWGHGFVDARRIKSRRGGAREAARAAARYGAKYLGKGAATGFGRHSYEVREGYQETPRTVAGWTRDQAWAAVVAAMGGEVPAYEWQSVMEPGWRGPPVEFLSWG